MLPFEGGNSLPLVVVVDQLLASQCEHDVEGITLLGGEPFAHAAGALALAKTAHDLRLNVMIFTGYTIEELRSKQDPAVEALLGETDILVDGPYLREQPETKRRWIGSANQRIHFLSDRCRADDPRWKLTNTLEIRLTDGVVTVNGFPAAQAKSLWKPSGK
jgi:anaerobic ribonucleoside-triphosphate reductase activating protein